MKSVVVEDLCKSYGEVRALQNISFEVKEGEIYGIIAPDGAGKTSLFRILTTLLLADSGSATVCGCDVVRDYKKIRQICGYMPGRFSLYGDLSVKENLNFFASLFNSTIEENYHLVEDIYKQIEPFKNRRADALSGGMKQKLALCCALIHRPEILFLDEPTTGVDPVSRAEFWDMLSRLKNEGITIIVSTPYMDEAARCSRIALMQSGRILQEDTPQGIINSCDKELYSVKGENMYSLLNTIREWQGTDSCYAFGESHHLTLKAGYDIDSLSIKAQISRIQPTIEDCFMTLM
ncbi:MAG: ABC transporter ATP-binding protein [Rikenellaceae bacterium]